MGVEICRTFGEPSFRVTLRSALATSMRLETMKAVWTGAVVLLAICATEVPAFACSCSRVLTFEEEIRERSVVVVAKVTSTHEVPPAIREEQPGRVTVRPPFMGTGISMAVTSVVKGNVDATSIRAWDVLGGTCAAALWAQTPGSSIVIALEPVTITPAEIRRTWGSAAAIPETDYFASSGCGNPVRVLSPEDLDQWIRRKLP
jgi:hypothetical protein